MISGDTCIPKRDEITLYDVIDTDHEYKGLDKYSKRDGEIKLTISKGIQEPVTAQQDGTAEPAIITND